MSSSFDKISKLFSDILFTKKGLLLASVGVIALEVLLTHFIIQFVPYTEIDWKAYMQQAKMFKEGKITQYDQIEGDTGPLVYPALHLYAYTALSHVTNAGTNIKYAQAIFQGIYIFTMTIVIAIYNKTEAVPPYILPLLALSKRLHSIYVLRLFNDCVGIGIFYVSLLDLMKRRHFRSAVLFSLAVGVKMNVLLFLPAYAVVYVLQGGLYESVKLGVSMISIQILIARPFLRTDGIAYLSRAFNLSRQFLFKWTVNWRFIGEDVFLSREFSNALLAIHITLLALFAWFKWLPRDDAGSFDIVRHTFKHPSRRPLSSPLSAKEIARIVFTCNLIGVVCARSLHYQFYSWYAHQIPFLSYTTRYPLIIKIALCVAIEYAWNVFPSTDLSSGVLLAANSLLLLGQAYA